jgi:hypothetical protein
MVPPGPAEPDYSTEGLQKKAKNALKQRKKKSKFEETLVILVEDEDEELSKWVVTVGLEIHAQLNTNRKLFSGSFYHIRLLTVFSFILRGE